ncbi:MAG TPA: hypothetical protein VGC44_11685 [Longimicrobiales bacterium]
MKRFFWMAVLLLAGACSDELPTSPGRGPVLLPAVTVVGTDVLYTSNAAFDQGTLVNVNHDPPGSDQLQLNRASGTFPFIWVALSQRCTIAKINTATGAILGEYRTIADNVGCNESSRTTVSLDGSVWVGHRGRGGATHVGLIELNQCVDRNGNSAIETSTGYGDVKAWPGATSVVSAAQDECIVHHVDTDALNFGDTRHMSIDANNKLWIGDYAGGHRFVRVDGATGVVETVPRAFGCGGYGGLIDKNGVIWSANGSSQGLLRWDPNAPDVANVNPRCINGFGVYGLAADASGNVFVTTLGSQLYKVSNDGNTVLGPFNHGAGSSQGLAVDGNGDVWVSSSLFCSSGCTIGHLKNDGTFVGNVPNPTGGGSTGVAVDASGKIWTANRNSNTATRIDPTQGPIGGGGTPIGAVDLTVNFPATTGRPSPFPYNYSDMTGAQLLNTTAPQGSWTINQDGGAAGTDWGTITWNTEGQGSTPAGAQIVVEARAADSEAALGSQTFIPISNGVEFDLTGQFIQVRVTLKAASNGTSPVLSDIRIAAESSSLQVAIDVRPGSTDNWIVPERGRTVPVAILSAPGFDAPNDVDRWSLTFGKTGDEGTLSFPNNVPKCVVEDVNGDARADLVCHFNAFKTNLVPGDTEAFLKGKTVNDTPFAAKDGVRVYL